MSALSLPIVAILGAIAAIALAAFAAFHLLGIVFWIVGGAIVFAFQSVRDAFQLVVGIFRVFFNVPRIVLAIILGRWSAARHYGDALETALLRCVRLIYQLFIGNFWEVFISRPMKARKESPKVESYASATRKKAQAAYQAKRAELVATYHGLNPSLLLKQINGHLEQLWRLADHPIPTPHPKVKTKGGTPLVTVNSEVTMPLR